MSDKRWLSTGYLKQAPTGKVDRENGIIEGVSVCTAGEAKGHGVHLDSEFIETVVRLGTDRKQGLKARFGHPNMCSTALGTFIGRFKNFSMIGNRAVADLFMSNECKETPHGNLYDYVLGMAENEPDVFGTSIVFTPGRAYQRDEDGTKVIIDAYEADGPVYVECESLHACDAVDDPAANEGLFSAFSKETIAGQMTEFLDLHPQVFELLNGNSQIVEVLSRYGDKLDVFLNAYTEHRKGQKPKEKEMSKEQETKEAADLEAKKAAELEAAKAEKEKAELEAKEKAEAEQKAKEDEEAALKSKENENQTDASRKEFARMKKAFGAEIASEVFESGGGFNEAREIAFAKAIEENKELRKQVEELSQGNDSKPAGFSSTGKDGGKPARIFKDDKLYK